MAEYPWIKSYPENIKWDAPIASRPLFAILDEAEARYPNRSAMYFMGRSYSFKELASEVRKLAGSLRKMGVNKGVKVGLFMPNCPQFVISYYAILKAGGTVVNYNPLYSARELHHQITDSGTEIMITLSLKMLYDKLHEFIGTCCLKHVIMSGLEEGLPLAKRLAFPFVKKGEIAEFPHDDRHHRWSDLMRASHTVPPLTIHPDDDIAVLQYTGGTTGVPKGAVLTHANLYANAVQCGYWFAGLKPGEERIMGVLPLFHVFAMTTVMNLAIHTGSQMILHPRFEMKPLLEDIAKMRPTLMPGVPAMFAAINQYRALDKFDLTSLKMCISGGAPLPMEVKSKFEQVTGCKLIEGYGLSETSPVTSANPLFGKNKSGSIGIPVPGTIMEITDIDNPTKLLGVGERGEVCIRGPQVMRGYYQQFDETKNVLRDGRLHTGDIGYMDEEGYFFIVDRLKEMIISGGYNIYPRTIEELLYAHPQIVEAAVIGITHAQRGQVPKAFIVRKEGSNLSEVEVKTFLRDKLSAYALPGAIEFRDKLPKSAIGKILKKELLAEELAKK